VECNITILPHKGNQSTGTTIGVHVDEIKGTVPPYISPGCYKKYTVTTLNGWKNFMWLLFMLGCDCYLFAVVVD